MKPKYIIFILIILISLTFSGCISEKQTHTGNIKTFITHQCPLCTDISSADITFDEGNLLIKDTLYRVENKTIIETLYKSYKQNNTVQVEYHNSFISNFLIITNIKIIKEGNI